MKSPQDYINIYRSLAMKLGIQGDSSEILVQLLANASYIGEVENMSYAREASLEKASLMNSKIQHCMDEMYSVYRGACPRVLLNITPLKHFTFKVWDELISSNGFKIYYLGYWDGNEKHTDQAALAGFNQGPVTLLPGKKTTLVGLLAKETSEMSYVLSDYNTWYVENTDENLSSDMFVKINGKYWPVSRIFSDHILDSSVFDLTIPSFGSRLYLADILRSDVLSRRGIEETPANTKIQATYFKLTRLEEYNESALKSISLKGAKPEPFEGEYLSRRGIKEWAPGISYIPHVPEDSVVSTHYRAARNRFTASIMRSNTDLGVVLEEMWPNKVRSGGTSYEFLTDSDNSVLTIYYVPQSNVSLLTETEIQEFVDTRSAYYITDLINVEKGNEIKAVLSLNLELFQNTPVDKEIKDILSRYSWRFGVNLDASIDEIKSLISKISNVKKVIDFEINYLSQDGAQIGEGTGNLLDPMKTYYSIDFSLNTILEQKGL